MEVSLDLSLVYVPKTFSECLKQVMKVEDASQKLSKIDDYVKRLEDERKKINTFKDELPLCILLLNDVIMRLKEEATRCNELNEEQAMIEEVLPSNANGDGNDDKRNWMSSVQLWNSDCNDLDVTEHDSKQSKPKMVIQRAEEDDDRSTCENPLQSCNHMNDALFKSLSSVFGGGTERKEEKEVISRVTGLSLMIPASELGFCNLISKSNDCNQMKVKTQPQPPHQLQQQYGSRKQRRSWSPDLHRRFVDALQQLGGSEAATPKQIRELLQVDGLTNDEVKSHLQKYRLHLRKFLASSASLARGLCASQGLNLDNTVSNSSCGRLHENGHKTSIF